MNFADRAPKDVYFFYKASWSDEPVLHIASREWSRRAGAGSQPVTVYSNLDGVELFRNGQSLGVKAVGGSRRATWDVPFVNGGNVLEARGSRSGASFTDQITVDFAYQAPALKDPASPPFRELGVNAGSNAQFIGGFVWEADRPYVVGGWGYVGGGENKTTRNVLGTEDDPLYRTYRSGMQAYRFDVPDGRYEVELKMVEPLWEGPGSRVFDVSLNGVQVVNDLDLAERYGSLRAGSQILAASASGGKGVVVGFTASVGAPIVSAVRVGRVG